MLDLIQKLIIDARRIEGNNDTDILTFDEWYSMHYENIIVDKETARASYNRLLKSTQK